MASFIRIINPPYLVQEGEYNTDAFQSICMYPDSTHQDKSFEELRLQHYNAGLKNDAVAAPSCFAFQTMPVGGPIHHRRPIRASCDITHKLDGDVVIFLVGTHPPKKFTVHEDIVKPRSEFVRLALRGYWVEATSRTIPLPDDEPAVFSVYQQWLYNGLVHTSRLHTSQSSEPDQEYELLVKAYVLGEKIVDGAFKDSIIDAIVEKVVQRHRFNKTLTTLVFENTPQGSPLRRLWMDVYYHFGDAEWLEPSLAGDTISPGFMIEFSRYQMQNRTASGSDQKLDLSLSCTYHEHRGAPFPPPQPDA